MSLFLLTLLSLASAAPLSDAGYLRKLSYHLRGQMPNRAEYLALEHARGAGQIAQFFDAKIHEYQASPQAADRLTFNLAERFQVRTPTVPATFRANHPDVTARIYDSNVKPDMLTDLFARLAQENLSWDNLLTSKRYTAFASPDQNDEESISDSSFFEAIRPDVFEGRFAQPDQPVPVTFAANDVRVAGALTTARFIERYATTIVNKNRRRAAAVFRIFLCDPMFPVIPPPPDRKEAGLAQAFADQVHGGQVTEKQLTDAFTVTDEQRHGSDKRCVACHYKLDPVGKTFQGIGMSLSPFATPGHLRYTGLGGRKVNERLRGIGDLGTTLAAQPEYVRCQVNWFWSKYIGSDVPLGPERLAQLSTQFDAVGRRTNDFIRILVTAPEFRERPTAVQGVTFARVSPYLQRCDSCHAATNNLPMFSAGNIPADVLAKMKFLVNLPAEDARRMPLDWGSWDPKELDLVKQ